MKDKFWKETAKLMNEYRKEGNEQRVQGIVDCRILFDRLEKQLHKPVVSRSACAECGCKVAAGHKYCGECMCEDDCGY